jgi:dUTP pyrophosphatase
VKEMELKIKKLIPEAVIPQYAKNGDACFDIVATSISFANPYYIEYGTGLAMEVPEGFVGTLFPRSSISNTDLTLANSTGILDSGYRGEIKFRFRTSSRSFGKHYAVGDRIGQMMLVEIPKIKFKEVTELSTTERGEGGYGSSGR